VQETVMKVTRFNELASHNVCTSMKLDFVVRGRSDKIRKDQPVTIFVIQHRLDVQVSHSSLLASK